MLGGIPSTLSAIALNPVGLAKVPTALTSFMRVFLNPQYSHALQSSASSIGVAVEELMRHHAPLQETGMTATLKILEDLVALGSQVDNSPDKKDEQAKKREFFIDSIHSFSKVLSFHFSLKEAYSLTLSFFDSLS